MKRWGGCAGGGAGPVLHPAADTQAKTHAEGFGSWTLPPMVGSDGGPKTIVVRIPELPSYNPIDPGLSLLKKIPLPLAPLASWRFKSLFSPSSSTSRDLRSVALQSLVAGRHLARSAAGRDSHFQDPRSTISAGGGTRQPLSRSAIRDHHWWRDATGTVCRGTRQPLSVSAISDPRSPPAAEYWPGAGHR